MPKASSFPYYDAANVGAERAAKELGAGFSQVAPATIDAAAQASLIDTQALKPDVCALMISANDREALNPAVARGGRRARPSSPGTPTSAETSSFTSQQASNEVTSVPSSCRRLPADRQRGPNRLPRRPPDPVQPADLDRDHRKELAKPEYAGIEVVKTVYTEGQDQEALRRSPAFSEQYPDLKGMIAPDAVNMPVAARVIKDKGLVGKVKLTGLALPSQMRNYVKDGTLETFALWDVEKLGYLTYYVAHALGTGKIKGEPGETVDAGTSGEFTITDDREIELGPLLWFNKAQRRRLPILTWVSAMLSGAPPPCRGGVPGSRSPDGTTCPTRAGGSAHAQDAAAGVYLGAGMGYVDWRFEVPRVVAVEVPVWADVGMLTPVGAPCWPRVLFRASRFLASASGRVWRYFWVVVIWAWPIRSITDLRSEPPASSQEAWAWRRSWTRTSKSTPEAFDGGQPDAGAEGVPRDRRAVAGREQQIVRTEVPGGDRFGELVNQVGGRPIVRASLSLG